jgi:hypothetical protein
MGTFSLRINIIPVLNWTPHYKDWGGSEFITFQRNFVSRALYPCSVFVRALFQGRCSCTVEEKITAPPPPQKEKFDSAVIL